MTAVLRAPFRLVGFALSRRLGRRLAFLAIIAAALAAGYFLWLRDSSIVAVKEVEVSGAKSNTERVRRALELAAAEMTTLNVREGELRAAVAHVPTVKSLRTKTSFPNGLTIRVIEHVPVAMARGGGRTVPVAADGTVLVGLTVADTKGKRLPSVKVSRPTAARLEGPALAQARVLGAAPAPLRSRLGRATMGRRGITVEARNGVKLLFGESSRAVAKWAAATRILADPESSSLSYIDLRVPGRPAVGGLPAQTATPEAEIGSPPNPQVLP